MEDLTLKIVARIRSDFPTKFGIPRQSGLVDSLTATVVFEPDFQNPDALRGLEDFTHIWLLWGFSEAFRDEWSPTVRPPRLGGNARMGVFATRSPFRPNPLGLSCVRLISVEQHPTKGPLLHISGADLMDGTPIYDIKPYLLTTDCRPEASPGFTAVHTDYTLSVDIPAEEARKLPADKLDALHDILAQDPRPAYHHDDSRKYGFPFAGYEVQFVVQENVAKVLKITKS
ncbi:MAG: tRNA (N6-threonylcarbamoyladenosine(37)-N6)-methyltransferase TrmO [Bacteroidales bacterium]|nr:tRNA (N6-threonylcarbamoyladenosine(37)-N6)-methyltransferase TrmO [Bacteroidales bacterium]